MDQTNSGTRFDGQPGPAGTSGNGRGNGPARPAVPARRSFDLGADHDYPAERLVNQRPTARIAWALGVFAFAAAAAGVFALLIGGVALVNGQGVWNMFVAGALGGVLTLLAWPIASGIGRSARATDASAAAILERLQTLSVLLQTVSEQQLLSDRAKAVAYRDNDREALRRAIREDLSSGDYEAALSLCDEMETNFGYKQEAEGVREDVRSQRDASARQRINEAMGTIEQHARAERWQAAFAEANRLAVLYPEHEEVRQMPVVIEARRQNFKTGLVDAFVQASARSPDEAIEVLRRLDTYLTPAEGERLQESARKVFREKLGSLKDDLSRAVHEQRFAEAVRVAEEIAEDYPNTQMAREVKAKLPSLRQRAGMPPVAA